MFNMFDVFRQAQGGAAFDNLSRAYGVSPDQLRAMTAALTPAFAQGFMRQAATDEGARRFAELFRTEDYARAFEAQAAALDSSTRGAGENALDALFGSKEVSRAVAAQAAAASGVQAQIIRQVLPVLASILMGGFMKAAQGAGAPTSAFDTLFGGGKEQAQSPFPANPFQGWIDAFNRSAEGAGGSAAGSGQIPNPLGDMMGEMMKSMFGAPAQPEEPEAPPYEEPAEPKSETAAENPFDDFVATGRELSQQNAEAMSQIFDAFFSDKPKKA
ncbi:DUF937 domain-containing protein [Chenggangzhangella methanolivorans]|uniref:DUF937 domain-containing protein n=1 Tax=Chenggangzhangella methanolivorans TaxID=1437009 RepID=A0A9E6RDG8_9HYPH|nr:DUF937 domain-containing protein [Chenggangzhangella methanolivorans]QZN98761.1 DUF937 domain-containing protein [Chenggangzhangella methanolivorans]